MNLITRKLWASIGFFILIAYSPAYAAEIKYESIGEIGDQGLTLQQIQKIASSSNFDLSHSKMNNTKFLAMIPHLSHVTRLDLGFNEIDPAEADIQNFFCTASSLTSLDLQMNKIGTKGEVFGEILTRNTTLTSLRVGDNDIKDQEGRAIAGALKNNTTLRELDLSGNPLSTFSLFKNTTLTSLNLGGTRIKEGVVALAEILRSNTALTSLILEATFIEDNETKILADALLQSGLTYLNLSFNEIGNQGGREIAESLKTNKVLIKLNLKENNMQDEVVKDIENAWKPRSESDLELAGNGVDEDSEDESNYDYKSRRPKPLEEKGNYIPVYRGVHYLEEVFKYQKNREDHRIKVEINHPLFSSAVYKLAGGEFLSEGDGTSLEQNAVKIKTSLENLANNFPDSYHKFHEVYTNDHKEFHQLLKSPLTNTEPSKKQAFVNYRYFFSKETGSDVNQDAAVYRNPHISFSLLSYEAIKYALGFKSFHSKQEDNANKEDLLKLRPMYDTYGRPKHVYIGKVYGALIKEENFKGLNPYLVLGNHANGKIKISTHSQNNILSENEVSFSGYLPEDCIVYAYPIRYPSFHHEKYPEYYEAKYGIDKKAYEDFRDKAKKGTLNDEINVYKKSNTKQLPNLIIEKQIEALGAYITGLTKAASAALSYPEFEGDFLPFPLTSRTADIYSKLNNPKIKCIELFREGGKTVLSSDEIFYLLKKLSANTSVNIFSIQGYPLEKLDTVFGTLLKNNKVLTSLSLENALLSAAAIEKLVGTLQHNTTLRTLSLRGNTAVNQKIDRIAEALSHNQTLTELNLGETGLVRIKLLKDLFVGDPRPNQSLVKINIDGNLGINPLTDKDAILKGVSKNRMAKYNA